MIGAGAAMAVGGHGQAAFGQVRTREAAQRSATIRRGVSPRSAEQLDAMADRFARDMQARRFQLQQALQSEMERAFRSERAALDRVFESSEELTSLREQFEAVAKASEDLQSRRDMADEDRQRASARLLDQQITLLDQHERQLQGAFFRARLSESQISARTLEIYERLAGKRYTSLVGQLGTLQLEEAGAEEEPAPPQTAFSFSDDFEDLTELQSSGGVASAMASANASGYTYSSLFSWLAGGGRAQSLVGDYLTIAPGFSRMRITARFQSRCSLAACSLGGASAGSGEHVISMHNLHSGSSDSQTYDVGSVIAPLLYFSKKEIDATYNRTATFDIPDSGGEFLIKAGSDVAGWAGVNAWTHNDMRSTVEQVSIELLA